MTKAVREQERQEAIEQLRKMLKPGDTVYTVLRHVSRSGMTRGIDCYYMSVEERTSHDTCECRDCAVCKGSKVICGACGMCARCHEHRPECEGCKAGQVTRKAVPVWITAYVGKAIDSPQPMDYWRKSMGLKIGGCGMDMGFHVVYTLSRVLFHDKALSKDGGYALNHAWL